MGQTREEARQRIEEINVKIMETLAGVTAFSFCEAKNISLPITELISYAVLYDKEEHKGKKKLMLGEIQRIIDHELKFI